MQLSSLNLILTAVQDNSSVIMMEWMWVQSGCISNYSCIVPYQPQFLKHQVAYTSTIFIPDK
jgi:hypothetical protein